MEGSSLLPALHKEATAPRTLFWEHEGNRAVLEGAWKLVAREDQPWELYNLRTDRVEMVNLASKYPGRVSDLAAKWESWAVRTLVKPSPGKVDRG